MPSAIIIGQGGGGGTGGGGNASVGLTGAAAPTSATELGIIVGGNLVAVSAANPLPISGGSGGTQYTDGTAKSVGGFQITVAGLYKGTAVVGLRGDSSDNLNVNLQTAIPAGSNLIGQVEITDGTNVLGTSSHPVRIDPTGTTAQPILLTGHAGATLDGTAGSPSTGVLTVQGVGSGTAIPVSGTIAVTQSGAWNVNQTKTTPGYEAITDGTNGPAAVKAASTAAVATDPSLVVALSPNSPIPAGPNAIGTVAQGTAAASTAGWPVIGGNLAEITAAWTSATAGNTALIATVTGYSTVVVTLNGTPTISGGFVTFEVSDASTNWYTISVPISVSGGISPNTNQAIALVANLTSYQLNVAGYAGFRVRLSTVITGTGTMNVGIQAQATCIAPAAVQAALRASTSAAAPADNTNTVQRISDFANNAAGLYVADSIYGGAFSGTGNAALSGWSKRRASTVFRTAQATASGNTAVWTPGSGNKFRLLKVFVEVTDNSSLASGAVLTINFQDATTSINISFDVFVPTTAVTTVIGDGLEQELDLGDFGILSAAANNVLNVNLSVALATGNVRIITMGTEE